MLLRRRFGNSRNACICAIAAVLLLGVSARGQAHIDSLSLTSLYLGLYAGDSRCGQATGFVVRDSGRPYLITNWHVVTGRHPTSDSLLVPISPNSVSIWYPVGDWSRGQCKWVRAEESLYDGDSLPRWLEHPRGRAVDVVAIPLSTCDSTKIVYGIDWAGEDCDVGVFPAMPVSIIGFPKGLTGSGKFPIWKTGEIASEPDVDYLGLPAILVDVRTAEGMSGSPAFIRQYGQYVSKGGGLVIGNDGTRFVGVYSGIVLVQQPDRAISSDLGLIWKPSVIKEVLNNAK